MENAVKPRYPNSPASKIEIVAIAASLGGLKAISQILSTLPSNFPAAIVIVQHLHPKHRSMMVEILTRRISLPIKQAKEGDSLNLGVYIAPPDYHLLVNANHTLSLNQSQRQHFVRPSADILFNSVASSYRKQAIAVVLTGSGKDGIKGVQTIHQQGGIVIVQDEKTSECFSMPNTAIQTGIVDWILPLPNIADKLISLVAES